MMNSGMYIIGACACAQGARADCMIYLEGCTASAAPEVKSREHAFKVYHTGTAFYFACDSRDAMLAWIQLVQRATLLPALAPRDQVRRRRRYCYCYCYCYTISANNSCTLHCTESISYPHSPYLYLALKSSRTHKVLISTCIPLI